MHPWYYAKGGRQNGPVSLEELRALFRSGELGSSDLVWNESMKDWVVASSVAEIAAPASVPVPLDLPAVDLANPYATPGSTWVEPVPVVGMPLEGIPPGSDPIGVMACLRRGFDLTKKQAGPLVLGMLIFMGVSFVAGIIFSMIQGIVHEFGGGGRVLPPEMRGDPVRAFQWGMRTQFTPLYFIQQAVSMVISSFMMAGYYRICLNVVSGLPASPGQIFGESAKLMRMLGVTVLLSVPSWISYVCFAVLDFQAAGVVAVVLGVIGLVLWIRLGFAGLAVVDRNLGVAESLKYSFTITKNNGFRLVGLGILAGLVMALGVIACFVGLVFTVPVGLMAFAVAYRWMQYGRVAAGQSPV